MRPDEVSSLISRLENGEHLSGLELQKLNRLLIEANYPLEAPKMASRNVPRTSIKEQHAAAIAAKMAANNAQQDAELAKKKANQERENAGIDLDKGVFGAPLKSGVQDVAKWCSENNVTVKNLTKQQVEKIFTGDVTDWSAAGGNPGKISIYTRNTSSGSFSDWKELAMNKRDYAAGSQKLAGNEQIVAEVAKNPNGIGYVGLAYIKAPGIKVVAVEGQTPNAASVRGKTYPYARPTFYFTNGEPVGKAKAFVDFTLSAKGQAIVDQVGFVSVGK